MRSWNSITSGIPLPYVIAKAKAKAFEYAATADVGKCRTRDGGRIRTQRPIKTVEYLNLPAFLHMLDQV